MAEEKSKIYQEQQQHIEPMAIKSMLVTTMTNEEVNGANSDPEKIAELSRDAEEI